LAQLRLARLEQSDPDEFRAIGRTADRLIERDRTDPLAIAIETDQAAYPKRLGTPQRRMIEAEETPTPADSMTSLLVVRSAALCRRPTPDFIEVTRAGAVSGCGTMRLGRSGFNRSVEPVRRSQ
jgi:hypothetical protein